MTYDFDLFYLPEGADPMQAHQEFQEEQERIYEGGPGPIDPAKEKRKQLIVDALLTKRPDFEVFVGTGRSRCIELTAPEGGNGIQISLFDDGVSVTVPYWHNEEQARKIIDEIWSYLTILEKHGLAVFDPQLDKVLDLKSDVPLVLKTYGGVMAKMPEILGTSGKPWWKFW